MATYKQLLIEDGGGILERSRQSAKQKNATLIIGLGGMGGHVVQNIKKEVYRQLQPDDPESLIPEYRNIRFLIIDSDVDEYHSFSGNFANIDREKEVFELFSNDAPAYDIKNNWSAIAMDKSMSWLNDADKLPLYFSSKSAGCVRQVGRFLLVRNVRNLYEKIQREIQAASVGCDFNKTDVYICAGLSGGTGSGIFLDVCYLVQKAMMERGDREGRICGYFFLPDVYLTNPAIMSNPTLARTLQVNGYCAMQELDYCMNYDKNLDSFKMDYGEGIIVDNSSQPVDLCYLVSGTDNVGNMLKDGYKYAMDAVTEHMIHFLSSDDLPAGISKQNNGGATMEEHAAFAHQIQTTIRLTRGASHDYNTLGVSVAETPLTEIATYLGVKLFENIDKIYDKVPTKQDRDDFQTMLNLQYKDLISELMKGCVFEIRFDQRYNGSMLAAEGVGPFNLLFNQNYDRNVGIMEKNVRAMLEDLSDFKAGTKGTDTSLIGRLFKALYEKFVFDFEFGPIYAERMLYGPINENIYNAVRGLIEANSENMRSEEFQEKHIREQLDLASEKAKKASLLTRNSCANNLKAALNAYFIHECRMNAFEIMNRLLARFLEQIGQLEHEHFSVLSQVMHCLRDTFRRNGEEYDSRMQDDRSVKWKILSNSEIAKQLNAVTQDMNVNLVFCRMIRAMIEREKDWIEQDENKICRLISDFILDEFHDLLQKTMTEYLRIRYNATTMQELSGKLKKDLIQDRLWECAVPLFWQSPESYDEMISSSSTLLIPYNSSEIEIAADTLNSMQGTRIRRTTLVDKISLVRNINAIPMYAYQGLKQLEDAYESYRPKGCHLFERDVDWNELLPSPIPLSLAVRRSERQARKVEEIVSIWARAKEKNIIESGDWSLWHMNLLQDVDMDVLEAEFETIPRDDIDRLVAFNEKLKDALTKQKRVDINGGFGVQIGFEEQVSLDVFASAPKMVELVVAEMKLRDRLAELKRKLMSRANS